MIQSNEYLFVLAKRQQPYNSGYMLHELPLSFHFIIPTKKLQVDKYNPGSCPKITNGISHYLYIHILFPVHLSLSLSSIQ